MLRTARTHHRGVAAAENINESYVGRVLRLTLLAPNIVETIPEWAAVGGDDAGGIDTATRCAVRSSGR
jgi:hypothetical protein